MQQLPILYNFRRCPYAMRARLSILQANIKVELREIVLRDKPAHMLQISPKATVPVLLLPDNSVIDESIDIMHWALNQNDPNQLLSPDKKQMQNLIKQTDGSNETHFKHHLDRYKYSSRYDDADQVEQGLKSRSTALLFVQQLEDILQNTPYLMGQNLSLADYAIAPFIRQFANTKRTWWDAQPYPHTQKWLNQFIASPDFQTIFKKVTVWQPNDTVLIFPFKS